MKTALYAGSFDPFTFGHKDIVLQARCVFNKVIVAIGENPKKTRTISTLESADIIKSYFKEYSNVEVDAFTGSLAKYAEERHVDAIVRGLRQVSDFNDEFTLNGVLSTVTNIPLTYFICHQDFLHVSSSTAREMLSLDMNVDWLINPTAQKVLRKKFSSVEKTC